MTPVLLSLLLFSGLSILSYAYYLGHADEQRDNLMYRLGSFIDGVWFDRGGRSKSKTQ